MVISLHFDGHFSWWTRVSRNQKVSFLDFIGAKGDRSYSNNWSCKTCKAPVRMSPPTNLHPVFYRQSMVIKNSKHTDQTKQDAVVYDQNGWIRAKSGRISWKLEESVCACLCAWVFTAFTTATAVLDICQAAELAAAVTAVNQHDSAEM